ncbi:ABC-F family ATP-binding cassette domain-containing protein [Candidatus Saccharibacteria bacterium]|nr:ABC-F family ATP-binding cassette domain-containing protein [Candidatus Saccharibacteria bacterium]
MIASVTINEKSFGHKVLYQDLTLQLQAKEKVGVIGRNGTGKTTLFNLMTGLDKDFDGELDFKKNLIIISSRQEHTEHEDTPVLAYILDDLPQYASLKHIMDTYPVTMGSNAHKIHKYSEALEQFSTLGYFMVEEEIIRSLEAYGLNEAQINSMIGNLSGGQKRFVELVKVQHAKADLALIDEPTNHMDYIAKERFLEWFGSAQEAVVVITHDRDVLNRVDRIVEIRDGRAISFPGNYDAYLRINTSKITSEVNEFEVTQRRIINLKDDLVRFRRLKERARDPGTIHRFKSLEERTKKELSQLQQLEKPSFWIDKESVQGLNTKMSAAYEEHKTRNIKIRARATESTSNRLLIEATKLSLGYGETALFTDMNFQLREGDRMRLHGRNGAGKTTLVKAILAQSRGEKPESRVLGGHIVTENEIKIGNYEQEIASKLLSVTLGTAIEQIYLAKDIKINDQKIKQLLSDYLFNPATDGAMPLKLLSGGQKARFQLISMLADDPMVLILDEPTNHLDLPSIEEMEQALKQYHGAILYISHDTYFVKNIGGTEVKIIN